MDMDISMDIHVKSVDMDMDMDVKIHIHDNPVQYCEWSVGAVLISLSQAIELMWVYH